MSASPIVRLRTRTINGKPVTDYCIDCGRIDGKRKQFYRKTKAEAEAKAREMRDLHKKVGDLATKLTSEQIRDAARAVQMLEPYGVTVSQAAKAYIGDMGTRRVSITAAYAKYLDQKNNANLRERSIQDIESRLGNFVERYGNNQVDAASQRAIEASLNQLNGGPSNRAGYIRQLKAFFSWCVRQGYVAKSPMDAIELPKIEHKEPEFLQWEHVERFMHALTELYDPAAVIPFFALGFFCGIRTEELYRMTVSDVYPRHAELRIPAHVAKKRRSRIVEVPQNCLLWLEYCIKHRCHNGSLAPSRSVVDGIRKRICKQQAVPWPANAMRHTYATMALAQSQDAGWVAHQLGHSGSPELLYRHYAGLVSKDEGKAYFNIFPKSQAHTDRKES